MKKVLIPTKLDKAAVDILRKHGGYEVVQDDAGDVAMLAALHSDAYAVIVRSEPVTAAIIDVLPMLKVIIRAGAGYNTIDTRHARKKGIDVMNTPGANANAVAEEVIAMMLADARHVIKADISARSGKWEKTAFLGREISGKTVGIVGLGNIGRLVARRLSGFDIKMLGYDPVMSRDRALESGVELTDIETLFTHSDYITLHVPENDETRGMVNAHLLGKMKKGATLINCARAGVVDEDALRATKAERGLRFLNDVYPKDEAGPKAVNDIADIMLPHLGASTREANLKAATRAAEQLIELDDKGITSFIVNRDIPDGLDMEYCELANTLARLCRAFLGPEAKLSALSTSFYGMLKPFGDWLLVPLVSGLWEEIERPADARNAQKLLSDRGIEFRNRETDDRKGFENSITLDLVGNLSASKIRQISVRGTVTEQNIMISRINEFEKLYFEPKGHTVLFEYTDRPGVVAKIGAHLAERQINIEDMRHAHSVVSGHSLCVLRVNQVVPDALVKKIAAEINAVNAVGVEL